MTRNKKPVVLVAAILAALIIISLILLWFTRSGSSEVGGLDPEEFVQVNTTAERADFDLRRLAEKAEGLIDGAMAEALTEGDISLDFMSSLKRDADSGADALRRGKLERAAEAYGRVVQAAEARLATLALAEKARALSDSTYAELERLENLEAAFENSYREAVDTYNAGLRALNAGDYQASVDDFEMAGGILGDLEARSIQQSGDLIEAADEALAAYKLEAARSAYQSVLELDAANADAKEGLNMVTALEGITQEVKAIRALEAEGKLEAAHAELEDLATQYPENPFIRKQLASVQARILERDYQELLAASLEAEQAENFGAAVTALESALQLKSTAEQQARLGTLKEKYKTTRLEILLADGFDALKAGRYEAARNFYKEAVALAPESKEARTGLEKASSLYLANIRYRQNIAAADKYIKEGRFPLAAKLFNDAMASRPNQVSSGQEVAEARIRTALEAQSDEVSVTIESDKRTYVSLIGVFPPERFVEKELKLFPDVYKVRGTRSGYHPVEIDLKVNAKQSPQTIIVKCTEKI